MGLVKISITIPDEIFNEAKKISNDFSLLVTEALKEYIRKENVDKALKSFGKWEGRNKSSVEIVNELRKEEGRKWARGK